MSQEICYWGLIGWALVLVCREDEREVYAVPRRRGKPRLLVSAYAVAGVRVSPNGQRCVLATCQDDEGPLLISTLLLPGGEVERSSLPAGHEDAENIGILDDGRLVWTTGERPTQPDGKRTNHGSDVPPKETWPSIEERVDVWAWDPKGRKEPVCIYDAQQVWLDWRMPSTSDRLFICRVVEATPVQREFVTLLFDGRGPEVVPGREERFWSSHPLNPDGRFLVKDVEDTVPEQTRVHDAQTGKSRRLRETAFLGMSRVCWSPVGHRFLYDTLESPFFRLRWKGTILDEEEEVRWVVRLVDLGE